MRRRSSGCSAICGRCSTACRRPAQRLAGPAAADARAEQQQLLADGTPPRHSADPPLVARPSPHRLARTPRRHRAGRTATHTCPIRPHSTRARTSSRTCSRSTASARKCASASRRPLARPGRRHPRHPEGRRRLLPLDPAYPPRAWPTCSPTLSPRSCSPSAAFLPNLPSRPTPILCLDRPTPPPSRASPSSPPTAALQPANLAYLLYTSGSTGGPKPCWSSSASSRSCSKPPARCWAASPATCCPGWPRPPSTSRCLNCSAPLLRRGHAAHRQRRRAARPGRATPDARAGHAAARRAQPAAAAARAQR